MKKLIALIITAALTIALASCGITGLGASTVNFETYGGSAIAQKVYQGGETIISDMTTYKYGYKFVGWYFDPDLTEKVPYSVIASSNVETTWYARYEIDTSVIVHTISLPGTTTVDSVYAGHTHYILKKTSSAPITSIVLTPSADPAGIADSIELIRADGRPIADTNPDPEIFTPEISTDGAGDYVLIVHSKNLGYFTLTVNN